MTNNLARYCLRLFVYCTPHFSVSRVLPTSKTLSRSQTGPKRWWRRTALWLYLWPQNRALLSPLSRVSVGLTSILLILLALPTQAQLPQLEWAHRIGGGVGSGQINDISVDANGFMYSVGDSYLAGNLDCDPDVPVHLLDSIPNLPFGEGFLHKMDPTGDFIWARSVPGRMKSVGTDQYGNVYTMGDCWDSWDFDPGPGVAMVDATANPNFPTVFVQKFDTNGDLIWVKAIEPLAAASIIHGYQMAVSAEGNVAVTGFFSDAADFDPGVGSTIYTANNAATDFDIFLLKLDKDGNFMWANHYGGVDWDLPGAVAIDADEQVYLAGNFKFSVDFDPGPGTEILTVSQGFDDAFIQKLDAQGNLVWVKQITQSLSTEIKTLQVDGAKHVYVGGTFAETTDFDPGPGIAQTVSTLNGNAHVFKLDSMGEFMWVSQLRCGIYNQVTDLRVDEYQQVYLTGFYGGWMDFDPGSDSLMVLSQDGSDDFFLQKLDSAGTPKWSHAFGGKEIDGAPQLDLHNNGEIYFTGVYNSAIEVDPGPNDVSFVPLVPGGFEMLLMKLSDPTIEIGAIELEPESITLYPNPTNGIINVALDADDRMQRVSAYNSIGELVATSHLPSLDLSGLAAGLYVIEVELERGIEFSRVIKR